MTTPFNDFANNSNIDPIRKSFAITPSDTVLLTHVTRGIRVDVGGDGTLKFVNADGTTDTWTVGGGELLPIVTNQIFATGTTATGLHGVY